MSKAMQLVPFDSQTNLPAYLTEGGNFLDINKEVVRAAAFPVMSIKGKVFTLNKDGVKTVMLKPGEDDEIAQNLSVVFLRANMNAKTFYGKKYAEGDSDGARPDCYSYDGVAPSANAIAPQAKKCATCAHNQWGSRVSDDRGGEAKGKACQDNARIAIANVDTLEPILLRVPPASLKGLKDMLKIVSSRKVPYNAVVVRVGFDREAASPKLTFKPVGLMDDNGYAQVRELYEDEIVRAVVGLDDLEPAVSEHREDTPAVDTDELDAALAARAATQKASVTAKVAAEEVAPAKPARKKATPAAEVAAPKAPAAQQDDDFGGDEPAAPAAKAPSAGSSLLDDLDALLGNKDD